MKTPDHEKHECRLLGDADAYANALLTQAHAALSARGITRANGAYGTMLQAYCYAATAHYAVNKIAEQLEDRLGEIRHELAWKNQ